MKTLETVFYEPKHISEEITCEIPIIIRGKIYTDCSHSFGGRNGSQFSTPSATKYVNEIGISPMEMKDLYDISVMEIILYLRDLGERLVLKENPYLQNAYSLACKASGLTPEVLYTAYQNLPMLFEPSAVLEMLEKRIGIKYLEDWVPTVMNDGRTVSIRAFGARSVHIVAGNVPLVSAASLIRSCATRSDAIFKLPSNDPLTATALIQTMVEMDPNHPLTKHCSVLYWKGGDVEFENRFYRPENIEKIVAWGGYNSIKYISKYLQPGIDLITFDPKISISIIGHKAFQDENTLQMVAQRAAIDVGAFNQEACVNSRIMYVESGTHEQGIQELNKFGKYLYTALINLPSHVSTAPKVFDQGLKDEIDGIR